MGMCLSSFSGAAKRGVKVAVYGASFFVKGEIKHKSMRGVDPRHTKQSILLNNKAWNPGSSTTKLYLGFKGPRLLGLTMHVESECRNPHPCFSHDSRMSTEVTHSSLQDKHTSGIHHLVLVQWFCNDIDLIVINTYGKTYPQLCAQRPAANLFCMGYTVSLLCLSKLFAENSCLLLPEKP